MGDYVLTLLAAAAVTYLLTPLVRRFAIAIGAKHAARDRDVHVVPTPLLGGFAMYAGLAAGLLVAGHLAGVSDVFATTNMARGLLMAGGLLVVMGFVDDRWGMSAVSKLAGQVAAGVVLVWSGAAVTWLPAPGGGTLSLTSDQQTAVTILVVVMTINAVNFIDGLDGLAAGIVGIGAVGFFIYYYTLTHRLGLPDQSGPALASAVLAGICIGFLPHNFHPARIFMGDTGAMLIGLLLAYAPISSLAMLDPGSLTGHPAYAGGVPNRFGAILPLLLPAAILLIPYADLLMAVVRRTRAGMSPFAPDKKHLHHRLLDIGHSHRTSVLIMYLWAALFSGAVVWLSIVRTPLLVLTAVTVGCVLALLLVSMPRLRPWSRSVPAAAAVGPAPVADAVGPAPVGPAPVGPAPVADAVGSGPAGPGGPPASTEPGPVWMAGADVTDAGLPGRGPTPASGRGRWESAATAPMRTRPAPPVAWPSARQFEQSQAQRMAADTDPDAAALRPDGPGERTPLSWPPPSPPAPLDPPPASWPAPPEPPGPPG